jgi:tRNA (guanine-N7-)-methyltransferase
MSTVTHPRRIRSFVRRARSFSSLQADYYATLWQQFGVNPLIHTWSDIFSSDTSIGLDVGFGMGESLGAWAKVAQEHDGILGVEVHRPGILQAMQVLQEQNTNPQQVKIIEGDVLDVLMTWIPDGALQRMQILFPDPWPKRRHHKRRLVRAETLPLFISKLKSGGVFYFVSDWQVYAEAVQNLCNAESNLENLFEMNEVGHVLVSDPENTRFARKGLAQGHKIHTVCFRKV